MLIFYEFELKMALDFSKIYIIIKFCHKILCKASFVDKMFLIRNNKQQFDFLFKFNHLYVHIKNDQ